MDTVGTLTYTIVDANGVPVEDSLFEIFEDKVLVKAGLDADNGGGIHSIRVKVSDGVNAPEFKDFQITINDVDEPAVVTPATVAVTEGPGGAVEGTLVATISATDPEGQTVTVTLDDASEGVFELALNQVSGAYEVKVAAGVTLDRENPAHRSVIVNVSDSSGTVAHTIDLDLADVNDNAPTGVTLTSAGINEDAAVGDVVGTLSAVDPDSEGTYTYTIVDSTGAPVDDDLFEIVGNQVLVKGALNFETGPSHTIRVQVSDGANDVAVQNVTINVNDLNEEPTDIRVAGGLVAENAAVGKIFATLSSVDPDANEDFDYEIVTDESGATTGSHPLFEIVGDKIRLKTALDDADLGLHEIWVKSTDAGGNSYVKLVTVGAYNVNEAPENVTLAGGTVAELAKAGTVVGVISATDQDDKDVLSYRLVDDAGGRFALQDDGTLVVKNGLKLDYEQAKSHKVTVEVKDEDGLTTLKTLTVALADMKGEIVTGTSGSDIFVGGAEKDILNGGSGNDRLNGGKGNDLLIGGTGKDVFIFNTAPSKSNVDTIKSFSTKDDTMWLDNAIFKKLGSGSASKPGKLKDDFFTIGTKAKDKNDYIVYNNKTGALYYDADGSGKGAAVKFAQLDKNLKLTYSDFMII